MATAALGAENDDHAIGAAKWALRELGAERATKSWGLGGSQAISTEELKPAGRVLVLEGEAYAGLTIRGPDDLVARVVELVRLKLA